MTDLWKEAAESRVTIRARGNDPFEGLKGFDYISARGLAPKGKRTAPQTYAEAIAPFNEMLPSIQAICFAELKRQMKKERELKVWRAA